MARAKVRGSWSFSGWEAEWGDPTIKGSAMNQQTVLWGGGLAIQKLRAKGLWRGVKQKLMEEWRRVADEKLSNKKDYAQRYRAGISIEAEGDQLRFVVRGFEASKIELGWGPPDGGQYEDGLGEWKPGPARDMRSFIRMYPVTTDAEDPGNGGFKGAKNYARLTMGFAKTLSELTDDVRSKLQENFFASRDERKFGAKAGPKLARTRAKKLKGALSSLRTASDGSPGEPLDSYWNSLLPKQARKHNLPVLVGAFKFKRAKTANDLAVGTSPSAMNTASLGTVRTITDSPDQLKRKLWFTRGVRPNHILREAQPRFIEIIVDEIINKGM